MQTPSPTPTPGPCRLWVVHTAGSGGAPPASFEAEAKLVTPQAHLRSLALSPGHPPCPWVPTLPLGAHPASSPTLSPGTHLSHTSSLVPSVPVPRAEV